MMYNPPHPGEIIKDAIIEPLNVSVTKFAQILGISREALSRVLNGKANISINLARRLETANFSSARFWLDLQLAYDLWQDSQKNIPLNVDTQKLQQLRSSCAY